ncbi:hypothetical protein D3C74_390270 [compost metagenome]
MVFIPERLHYLLAADDFLYISVQPAEYFSLLAEQFLGACSYEPGDIKGCRCRQQHNQCHHRTDVKHQTNGSGNGYHSGKQCREALQQSVRDRIHIIHEPGNAVSLRMVVMELQRQHI